MFENTLKKIHLLFLPKTISIVTVTNSMLKNLHLWQTNFSMTETYLLLPLVSLLLVITRAIFFDLKKYIFDFTLAKF